MKSHRFVCLVLFLVTLLLYLPSRHFEFLNFDDPFYVQDNQMVQAGLTWRGLDWAFSSAYASNWHPLTWVSHMLDCELFGLDPGAPHLVNAMIHAANAALVFLLLAKLTGGFWPAAFAAAFFAWHPLRVESVAWISERKDVLSAFFGLLSLLAYLRYARERRRGDFWLTFGLFALAILSKPMLVTLPFVFLLLDYWPLSRTGGAGPKSRTPFRLLTEKWPFFLLSAVSCVLTVRAQQAEAIVSLNLLPMQIRLGNSLTTCMAYLGKMVWPVNLANPYSSNLQFQTPKVALAAVVLSGISWLVWRVRRTRPWGLVGWLWFLGTLVPVIGLVQVGSQSMADRYTYLPMIGVLIALAAALQELASRGRLPSRPSIAFATVMLGACLLLTHRQLQYWRDSISLFSRAVAVTTDNAVACLNLGVAYGQKGEKEKALGYYKEALRIAPNTGMAHNNLGLLLTDMGRLPEAELHFREALRLKPSAGLTYCSLGMLQVRMGKFDEAVQSYLTAVRLRPLDPFPCYLMAKAYLRQGRCAEAIAWFNKSLKLDPAYVKSQVYLARLLATSEDPAFRDPDNAVKLAEQANALTEGRQAFVLDTLAAAYAGAGRFSDAEKTVQQAIDIAAKLEETDSVAEMQKRLKLYQTRQPYRESPGNSLPEAGPAPEVSR